MLISYCESREGGWVAYGAIGTNFIATQAESFPDLADKVRGLIEVLREHQSSELPQVLEMSETKPEVLSIFVKTTDLNIAYGYFLRGNGFGKDCFGKDCFNRDGHVFFEADWHVGMIGLPQHPVKTELVGPLLAGLQTWAEDALKGGIFPRSAPEHSVSKALEYAAQTTRPQQCP